MIEMIATFLIFLMLFSIRDHMVIISVWYLKFLE